MKIVIKYALYVESSAGFNPAGHRLERNKKLPIDKFEFDTMVAAVEGQEKLQKYVDLYNEEKNKRKK